MKKENVFAVRQQILRDLKRVVPGILPPAIMSESPVYDKCWHADADDVAEQLAELGIHGFVEDAGEVAPGLGSHYRITASGLRQIEKMEKLSPVVWGAAAL